MEPRHQEFLARLSQARFTPISPRAASEVNSDAHSADAERPEWSETLAFVHRAADAYAEAQERVASLQLNFTS